MKTNTNGGNTNGRREFLKKSGILARYSAIAFLWAVSPLNARASDLIVNGTTQTITNGNYGTVIVKNSGVLNVTGTLTAQNLVVVTAGTLNISKNLLAEAVSINGSANVAGSATCSNLTIEGGTMSVQGTNNTITTATIAGQLVGLGNWEINDLLVVAKGKFKVSAYDSAPQSGTLFILANTIHVEKGGLIDGNGAGNDPRGRGHDWYANSDGGGHGGTGGRGYWDSSGGGNEGQAFGFSYTYESFMGGAGGYSGGGAIFIEAEQSLTLDGDIVSDGTTSYAGGVGGGAGGGILIRSPFIALNGKLSANGGHGYDTSGGGGGGRIKVFYGNETLGSLANKTSVRGGNAGGYLNTQPGQAGTIYRDFIPRVRSIIAPQNNIVVTNGIFSFQFVIEDLSQSLDGRIDTCTPRIELSRDGFQTVAYSFDQDLAVAGWSKALYYSGDTVIYTSPIPIEPGVYQWRVAIRDGSLSSRYTTPRSLGVEVNIPGSTIALDICLTPSVIIKGNAGTYRVEWANSLDPSSAWNELATVAITNNPTLYFDLSGVGQPRRFYRAELLQ